MVCLPRVLLVARLIQMPQSATAGHQLQTASNQTISERLAIRFPALPSNRTGSSEAAEGGLSFPPHKLAREVMLC